MKCEIDFHTKQRLIASNRTRDTKELVTHANRQCHKLKDKVKVKKEEIEIQTQKQRQRDRKK